MEYGQQRECFENSDKTARENRIKTKIISQNKTSILAAQTLNTVQSLRIEKYIAIPEIAILEIAILEIASENVSGTADILSRT